jgi:hypothetical protein
MVMYVKIGTTKDGLTLWRSTRGSSKNESVNLVAEHSLHTTGKMRERLATALLGGRFTRYNLRIERSLAAADQCGSSSTSSKARVVGFKHCHDLVQVGCCITHELQKACTISKGCVCVPVCVGNMEANSSGLMSPWLAG